ncbi:MAG: S8 family serine peptidase, partial [Candidatus Lokiarchaeota archaeon]|nr:S8 family serine peptidase [Candidatus Lokiarchaeota archaeon]
MHPPNVKTKALLLLLCVLAMNGSAMVVPSLARDAAQAKSVGSLHIDPGLLKAMEGGNADKAIPVIVTFNERTIVADRHAFLHAMEGSSFVLKHTYSIIPGISGSIRSSDLGTLKALSAHVSFRVCENTNYSIQMVTRTSSTGIEASHIEASQATSWWLDLIGRNQTIVQSLNLSTIKVGVLDTGIGFKRNGEYAVHADLAGSIGGSVNLATGTALGDVYDNYGHGTHVAGIIAGSGASSSNKYVGVAPGVKIYNIKVLNETGSGFEDDIIKGIEYAVNESLDIINLSLGGGNPDPLDPESMAVKNATAQGLLVVIANGNDGSGYFTVSSPAAADGCIAVGAIDQLKDVTSFSSRGPSMGRIFKPDVVAPGENIVAALGNNSFLQKYYGYFKLTLSGTTNANNDYVALDGTSMATPMVAGAAALILAKYRPYHLAPALVAASLLESAVDLGYDASTQGMGLINVTRALSFLESIKASNNLTSLARIYPKKLPYAPYDVISFPGQESTMMVKVLHHGAQSIHFDASAIPAGMQLAISPNTTTLNSAAGATFFNVSISTSFDAMPGNYSVDLVLKNASDAALDAIEIRFTLRVPRLRAYLDTYHSLEDMFPHGFPLARFAMDYYPYIKHLASEG